jgi:hypothetical protein
MKHFGETNPSSLRSTFPHRTGMIAADQPSGTTMGISMDFGSAGGFNFAA